MIDLETLAVSQDAVILAIGATSFELDGDDIFDSYYTTVDPVSCQQYGLKIDASTVMWWMNPERNVAREHLLVGQPAELSTALEGLRLWMDNKCDGVWSNAATFDILIMRNAYKAVNLECPWKFWQENCYRTIKNMFPMVPRVEPQVPHHALHDAVAQARHLQKIFHVAREQVINGHILASER